MTCRSRGTGGGFWESGGKGRGSGKGGQSHTGVRLRGPVVTDANRVEGVDKISPMPPRRAEGSTSPCGPKGRCPLILTSSWDGTHKRLSTQSQHAASAHCALHTPEQKHTKPHGGNAGSGSGVSNGKSAEWEPSRSECKPASACHEVPGEVPHPAEAP